MPSPIARLCAAAACLSLLLAVSLGPAFALVPVADDKDGPNPPVTGETPSGEYRPPIQPASDEAARNLSAFRLPQGMTGELVAAEPEVANPVAFWVDEKGRYWVCETFRQKNAVVDNRDYGKWLLDDLAAQTVEDRVAYFRKHLGEEGLAAFAQNHDRIRLLEDADGDGRAEKATTFATGFNEPEAGTGAGVMTLGNDVYYTCIPHLWRLRDTNGDGVADEQEKLLSGFGVRTAFRGHDMHGLTMGPDGRIYFSIGDRGYNVVTKEGKRLARPDTGAVFRCEPDGSNLEEYAYGLRNPQELAFDDYGNLFTGDNNSDSGDKARWVYVAEGSDSGWRMYYQYLDDRGPWNREMMWYPHDSPPLEQEGPGDVPAGTAAKDVQPAYILPPIANLADGPSGLTYYPGVGLPDRYKGHFFLCDFRGTPNNSGVRSFAVEPHGAGFKLVDSHEFVWGILATDADFDPNGRFVVSDWVMGWNGEGKGRLYGFESPEHLLDESAKLLAEDFSKRTPEQLIALFDHRDRRVRQKAHLTLAGKSDWTDLAAAIVASDATVPKLHVSWAAGIQARSFDRDAMLLLLELARDAEPIVRAQAVRAIGEAVEAISASKRDSPPGIPEKLLIALPATLYSAVKDAVPRVQREAVLGLGRSLRYLPAEERKNLATVPDILLDLVEKSDKKDAVLRQAIQFALAETGEPDGLVGVRHRTSPDVRTAAVVALRRMGSPKVSEFLADADPAVVTEATRAINDVPIDAATPQLAAVATDGLNDPTLRRVLNANFRLGGKGNAERVAKVAAADGVPTQLRLEALKELRLWRDPPKTDRVTGMYRPVVEDGSTRDAAFMADVLRPVIAELLGGDEEIRTAAIDLAAAYGIREVAPLLKGIVADARRKPAERAAALRGLAAMEAEGLADVVKSAAKDESAVVRAEALGVLATLDPAAAVPVLETAVAQGETREKQAAIETLAKLGTPGADAALARWAARLTAGDVAPEVRLDLVDALASRPALKDEAAAYEAAAPSGDAAAAWRDTLVGGDVERGKDIFLNRSAVSCQRCHKAEGRGGEVGPELTTIGSKKDRRYLLESIVLPNAKIAEGFESVVVLTIEGKVLTGVKREETDESLTLLTAEGQKIVIPKDEIEEQAAGKSAMPEDILKHLSKRDVRDLVEFLATRTEPPAE